MDSVIATVSGYHSSEPFKLIKMITQAGASYVGTLNQSTTHLVCWKFEGKRYEFARKFKTVIVNHRWVEDCIKRGRRVPEHPYILHCGQLVGPLLLDIPFAADKVSHFLCDQSTACNDSKEPAIDTECEETGHASWTDSYLLKETKELSLPSSIRLARQKRRSTTSAEPSRKGRRLVSKNTSGDILESSSDTEQVCHPIRVYHQHNDITAPSNNSLGGRNGSTLSIRGASIDRFYDHGGDRNEDLEYVEEIKNYNDLVFEDSLRTEGASSSLVTMPQDHCSDVDEGLNEYEHITRLSTSTELSCVICWTDFSSTRGVLPCGHRFCFSCIQNWADHMASNRKVSTCPLCKASFVSITKVDEAVSSDQKIYSQTIPHDPSTTDVYILPNSETPILRAQRTLASICCQCCFWEPEDLLIRCQLCQIRCIHSYCLDPPLFPWTCVNCKDLQMLYHHIR